MQIGEKNAVRITKSLKAPKEPGFYYRLMCMTGRNKGTSYYFISKRIVMGRSEKVDVQVLDGKSSREHAELALVGGEYVLTDLGSQNGIIINDLKVSQHRLKDNDRIIIGQTVFKYNQIEVKAQIVPVESDELEEYEDEDEEIEERPKAKNKKPKKKNNIVLIAIALLAVVFLLPEEGENPANKKGRREIGGIKKEQINLSAKNDVEVKDKETRDKLKAFIHRGQREYRERNYFRAIEQFELALILVPNHGQASFYLQKTRRNLQEHIKKIEEKGQQDEDALKLRSAIKQHCSVISFLQDRPEHEFYKEAEKNIGRLEEKLGYQKGEYKCF